MKNQDSVTDLKEDDYISVINYFEHVTQASIIIDDVANDLDDSYLKDYLLNLSKDLAVCANFFRGFSDAILKKLPDSQEVGKEVDYAE